MSKVIGLFVATLLCIGGVARAHAWPDRTVRIVVPFAPGGVPDMVARVLADRLSAAIGKPFVVENRPGAAGNLGAAAVARADPDGHTFLIGSSGTHGIHATLYKSLPFDPIEDFESVGLLVIVPNVLVVTNGLPARSLSEFVDYARTNPGKINYGSIGNGSSQHLAGTQFEKAAGVRLNHVPYRVVPQAVADLTSGVLDCMFQLVPNIVGQIEGQQVRALAVTTRKRSTALPEVPTMEEGGIPDYDTAGWFGLLAPKGTSVPILDRLNAEIRGILSSREISARLVRSGAEPAAGSREEFAKFIKLEIERWRPIVQSSTPPID